MKKKTKIFMKRTVVVLMGVLILGFIFYKSGVLPGWMMIILLIVTVSIILLIARSAFKDYLNNKRESQ
jgi:protein-S-isoprenylcysteine O-methyltransferase Ste14